MSDVNVRRALQSLPERQREAVVLHDVLGLRAREVGRALGLSLPAVEALLFRARRQLRGRLKPVAGVLTLPVGLRDALAQAIPGFADGSSPAGMVASGAAGLGVMAKLVSTPATAKVAVAAVAVSAAGTMAVTDPGRVIERSSTAPVVATALVGIGAASAVPAPAPAAGAADSASPPAAGVPARTGARERRRQGPNGDEARRGSDHVGRGDIEAQGAAPSPDRPRHDDEAPRPASGGAGDRDEDETRSESEPEPRPASGSDGEPEAQDEDESPGTDEPDGDGRERDEGTDGGEDGSAASRPEGGGTNGRHDAADEEDGEESSGEEEAKDEDREEADDD
jgi:hypothetical protein